MKKGLLNPSLLITHRIKLKDAPEILPQLYERKFHFIKVLIDMKL